MNLAPHMTGYRTRRNLPVRQSGMSSDASCPMWTLWSLIYGLEHRGVALGARETGTALHRAAEVLAAGFPFHQASIAVDAWADEILERTFQRASKLPNPPANLMEGCKESLHESKNMGLVMAYILFNRFPPDPDWATVDLGYEMKLKPTLKWLGHPVQGQIDRLVYMPPQPQLGLYQPGLFIPDYKKVPDDEDLNDRGAYFQTLQNDWQMDWYAHLLKAWFMEQPPIAMPGDGGLTSHDVPILGHIRYAIIEPGIKQKQGQTFDDENDPGNYVAECVAWYTPKEFPGARWKLEKRMAIISERPVCNRWVIPYAEPVTRGELPKHIQERALEHAERLRANPDTRFFPMLGKLTGQCLNWKGYHRDCSFRQLCHDVNTNPPELGNTLARFFQVREREADDGLVEE